MPEDDEGEYIPLPEELEEDESLQDFWLIVKINSSKLPPEKLRELKELFEELSYDWKDKPEN